MIHETIKEVVSTWCQEHILFDMFQAAYGHHVQAEVLESWIVDMSTSR